MQTEGACTAEVMKLKEYAESKEESLIQIARSHKLSTASNG
jgi:hypothetical protein